ncbi:hypothetical protein V6N13_129670 [Hibiscus sabdariffa]
MLIRMSQDVSSPMILPPSEPSGISITASGILNATASSYSMDSSATGEVLSKSLPKDLDLGYQGLDFTWSQGSTHACLDRMLCNHLWDGHFNESSVNHFFRMRLRGAQRDLEHRHSTFLAQLELDLQIELENILD